MEFLALFVSLPTRQSAGRMRIWRALRALGCATLRDGVYLLPDSAQHAAALAQIAEGVREVQGTAELYRLGGRDEAQQAEIVALFDRGADYARLLEAIRAALAAANAHGIELQSQTSHATFHPQQMKHAKGELVARPPSPLAGGYCSDRFARLSPVAPNELFHVNSKSAHALRREFKAIAATDYFPGEAQQQVAAALVELDAVVGGEPRAADGKIRRLASADFSGRTWATRKNLWVDRMASAWLIRRFIDRKAEFLWLDNPKKCPKSALGFDFDGAAFTHVGARVSFEVLAASFGLDDDAAIARIAAMVHCLDVGGVPVAEAAGVEAVLGGLRAGAPDDDKLLAAASRVFDGLYRNFQQENSHD